MRKSLVVLLIALSMMLLVPSVVFAAPAGPKTSGDPIQQFEGPFLLTSGGQGAGSKSLKLLLTLTKKFTYGADAEFFLEDESPARYGYIESGHFKTLVVVMSVTEKGLGASGITIEDEIGFLKNVVAKAKAQNMKIIAVSMEADARSKISTNGNERVIDTICPNADWIISVKANNEDGRFTKLGQQYGIPVTIVDKQNEFGKVLKQTFGK